MSITRPLYTLADRYRLDGRIAAGGIGEVWRATDLVLGRPVAVKLLRAEYVQHPETLARFRAEARHAGSLSHPHVARIYDYGEADATHPPFLVMELVDGPPLTQLLANGPMQPAHVMDVVAQAADGLAAAHAAGLVHRDIKPGNLLLAPPDQVKITDFGIAYAAGSAPITRTGMMVGTPAYVAPERLSGRRGHPGQRLVLTRHRGLRVPGRSAAFLRDGNGGCALPPDAAAAAAPGRGARGGGRAGRRAHREGSGRTAGQCRGGRDAGGAGARRPDAGSPSAGATSPSAGATSPSAGALSPPPEPPGRVGFPGGSTFR